MNYIKLNEKGYIEAFTINSVIEGGVEVDNIPTDVQLCWRAYKYINGEFVKDDREQLSIEKNSAIELASSCCSATIYDGLWIEYDGKKLHYSYNIKDQSNIGAIRSRLISGAKKVMYHADGEDFRLYSADEMWNVINQLDELLMYHTAYYAELKKWINRATSEELHKIHYGTELPEDLKKELDEILSA